MRPLISAILLASASLAVAVNTDNAFVRARHTQNARDVRARSPKKYTLVDHYSAQHFMNESLWSYFTGADPTDGQTKYLSHADASKAGLAYVQNGQAILAVDSKNDLPLGAERGSIRITSTKAYNGGLFIADFAAMAHGCADWPNGGEMDIIESVNLHVMNQYTLHTGPGSDCVLILECKSSEGSNAGCSFLDPRNTSFGHGFNMAGGGVFAHLWDGAGVKMWYFERQSIPQDIHNGQPNPSSWPTPVAFWSSLGCDFASHLHNHHLVINTALGGGWASSDYPNSGCPGTLSDQITKGENFVYAKWMINYIAVYK
ncbi:concanavalin A-like lectin/glucanase domain-containing protein [Lactarius pseudohatsudake]|nr:concanavalin A-like lectin/glucanase domain-containing protein [Lactarius pseudohatsudake]